jgi:hypothetical protein
MSRTVDNILALHHDMPNLADFDVYVCAECQKTQPCPTIRAVESEQALVQRRSEFYRKRRGGDSKVQVHEDEEILVRRRDGQGYRLPTKHTYHWVSATEAVR